MLCCFAHWLVSGDAAFDDSRQEQACTTVSIIEIRDGISLTSDKVGCHIARVWSEHYVARDWDGRHIACARRRRHMVHGLQ